MGKIRAGEGVVGIHLFDLGAKRFDERVHLASVDQHVVRGDAGLSRVEALTPGDAARRQGMSAVSSMTTGLLPPSSNVTGVRYLLAASITTFPTLGLPVKKMWSNRWARSAVFISDPPS
jgi:hypothetical protein